LPAYFNGRIFACQAKDTSSNLVAGSNLGLDMENVNKQIYVMTKWDDTKIFKDWEKDYYTVMEETETCLEHCDFSWNIMEEVKGF
jgi:hypothetical protein